METNAVKTFKKVVAELQATYNVKNQIPSIKVTSSENVASYIRKIYPIDLETREAFMCLYLNRANNVQGFTVISISSTL